MNHRQIQLLGHALRNPGIRYTVKSHRTSHGITANTARTDLVKLAAAEDQASDRAHRIGQTRPVTIYRLVTKGTIEEQIVRLHRRKPDPDSPNPSKRQHHLTCLP